MLEKEMMPSTSFVFFFLFEAKKVMAQTCHYLFSFSSIFCCKQGDGNKPNFSFFLLEVKEMMASILLLLHYFFFSCCYYKQGNNNKLATIAHFFLLFA
jgi:hypothetical protein